MWTAVVAISLLSAEPLETPPPLPPLGQAYVARPDATPRVTKPPPAELPPATFALYFAPFSVFSLTLWVEGDLHLASGVSVFANVGGGPLGQFGGDLGARYYVGGRPFEGFFLSASGSLFSLPAKSLWMVGPAVQLGYGWRIGRFALSIAAGFTTWYGASLASAGQTFFGSTIASSDVIGFPGLSQPQPGLGAVQPTIRISMGPSF